MGAAAAGRGGVRERARARLRRDGRGSRRARGGKRSPVISPAVSARLRGAGKGRREEVLTGGAARSVAGGDARGESLGWASGGDAGRAGCGLSAGPRAWAERTGPRGKWARGEGWTGLRWVWGLRGLGLGFLFPTLLLSKSNSNKV